MTPKPKGTALATTSAALAVPGGLGRVERVPENGEYWRVRRGFKDNKRKSLRRQTVLLVSECRYIDGRLHSVVVDPHPSWPDDGQVVFTLVEFLAHFAFEPQADLVRANEIAALQRAADAERDALARGPSSEELGLDEPTRELLALGAGVSQSSLTDLAQPENAARVNLAVQAQIKVAEAQSKWLAARGDAMGKAATALSRFYQERGSAAIARVRGFQEQAAQLGEGIKTMGLYLGTGVNVQQIAEGESADPAEKLYLFQAIRCMDEEYAVHLTLGGATWEDADAFADALRDNPGLRDRVLPTPRCVVAMRARRKGREFDASGYGTNLYALLSAFQQHIEEAKLDLMGFLLIRDGENVYRVDSELVVADLERLFPTQREKDEPFKVSRFFHGVDEATITPESTRYYEARNAYDKLLLFYRRLLVLMWGLDARVNLFGNFYDRAKYSTLLSLDLQTERFEFIYDDEVLGLSDGRPSFTQWWCERNATVQAGARVIVKTRDTREYVRASSLDETKDAFTVPTVFRQQGQLAVKIPKRRWSGTEFNAVAALTGEKALPYTAYLALDGVDLKDLDYYIESRVARREYFSYLALFMEARKILLAERVAHDDLCKAVEKAAPGVNEATVREAVAFWRAGRYGRALPETGSTEFIAAVRRIAAVAQTLATDRADIESAVAAVAKETGRTPLRVTRARTGEFFLYMTALPGEKPLGEGVPFPWVMRATAQSVRGLWALSVFKPAVLSATNLEERVLVDYPQAKDYLNDGRGENDLNILRAMGIAKQGLDRAVAGLEAAWGESAAYDALLAECRDHLAQHVFDGEISRGGLDYFVPVGIGYVPDSSGYERSVLKVVYLTENILNAAWQADERGPERIGRLFDALRVKKEPYGLRTSTPMLAAMRLSYYPNGGQGRLGDLDPQAVSGRGYDVFYRWGGISDGVLGYPRFEPGIQRAWGDELADQIERLATPGGIEGARLLYVSPGITAWLRGRTRAAVRGSEKARRKKRVGRKAKG